MVFSQSLGRVLLGVSMLLTWNGVLSANVEILSAFHIPTVFENNLQPEGNESINAAKAAIDDHGGYVYLTLRNGSADPIAVADVRWDGQGFADREKSYELVWQRLLPSPLEAGCVGEITIALRHALKKTTDVEVVLENGQTLTCTVAPEMPAFRIATITFSDSLRTVYLYVASQRPDAPLPAVVYRNGARLDREVQWLSDQYVAGVRVAKLTFRDSLDKGSVNIFQVTSLDQGVNVAASIRAFENLTIFGSYGGAHFERFADNGLTGYNSFGGVNKERLDQGESLGVRSVIMTRGNPSEETFGHPGIYAYGLVDEPDCMDYSVKDRPMELRVGANAPRMVEYERSCRRDSLTPTTLTVDLTFTPYNYFVYAPITDIVNPDCYAITCGWSIKETKYYTAMIKHASQPRPFTFTYQASWEEWAIPQETYISKAKLLAEGFDKYRDPNRVRGLGRAPVPSEVRIPMFYAIGCGARGLYSWWDATEISSSLMFHGSDVLPELWAEVGRSSRTLHTVSPLLDKAHPVLWVSSPSETLWVRTLLAGDQGVLVVVVNEAYVCDTTGFQTETAAGVFTCPDLPWLQGRTVYHIGDRELTEIPAQRQADRLTWQHPVTDAELYLIVADKAVAERLVPVQP